MGGPRSPLYRTGRPEATRMASETGATIGESTTRARPAIPRSDEVDRTALVGVRDPRVLLVERLGRRRRRGGPFCRGGAPRFDDTGCRFHSTVPRIRSTSSDGSRRVA